MGLGANLLVTQLAWTAGHKAMNYLPESWKNKIGGKRSGDEVRDFLTLNRMAVHTKTQIFNANDTVAKIDDNGKVTQGEPDMVNMVKSNTVGNTNWYYVQADDFKGGAGYTCMYLRVQGTETILEIPCVDGCPEIEMNVIQNEMPTASNELVTTNRRVKPMVFRFRFPIAYLRIYGENDPNQEVIDVRNSLQKFTDKVTGAINSVGDAVDSKIKSWLGQDNNDYAYDPDLQSYQENALRERSIPTYAQVLGQLVQFPRQFGCYLYMGFGFTKIGVTCSIKLTSQKGDMDCIWVDMTLVETMEFNFETLTSTKVTDWQNVTSTTSANSTGSVVSDKANSV